MGYKTFVSLNIAIVGGGPATEAMAARLASAGHQLAIGLKEGERGVSQRLLDQYENMDVCSIERAAATADVVVLSAPASGIREMAYLLDDVRKKVIIDATSRHPANVGDVNTINAIRAITGSQHVVKCYGAETYKQLLSPLFGSLDIDFFMAGDSKKAKEIVRILVKDMGRNFCYDSGGADVVPFMDEMHKSWQLCAARQLSAGAVPVSVTDAGQ